MWGDLVPARNDPGPAPSRATTFLPAGLSGLDSGGCPWQVIVAVCERTPKGLQKAAVAWAVGLPVCDADPTCSRVSFVMPGLPILVTFSSRRCSLRSFYDRRTRPLAFPPAVGCVTAWLLSGTERGWRSRGGSRSRRGGDNTLADQVRGTTCRTCLHPTKLGISGRQIGEGEPADGRVGAGAGQTLPRPTRGEKGCRTCRRRLCPRPTRNGVPADPEFFTGETSTSSTLPGHPAPRSWPARLPLRLQPDCPSRSDSPSSSSRTDTGVRVGRNHPTRD